MKTGCADACPVFSDLCGGRDWGMAARAERNVFAAPIESRLKTFSLSRFIICQENRQARSQCKPAANALRYKK